MFETSIYFVRHAESIYAEGSERTRGLTDKGRRDAEKVRDLLFEENIDLFVSSPYRRAVETIQPLAAALRKDIRVEEELRERWLSDEEIGKNRFAEAKRKLFENFDYVFPGGESSREAQSRACRVIENLLRTYEGKRVVIGTHGDIMTLMLNRYDRNYDFDFWKSTTMPDIYKLLFDGSDRLLGVTRLWMSS